MAPAARDEEHEEEEEEEEEEEAPSHLPLAPSSYEPCETSTVDPSYIISLIRKLLPKDAGKQDLVQGCNTTNGTMAMDDLDSDMNDIEHPSPLNCPNGAHQEFGQEERSGGQAEPLEAKDPWEECGCILWDLSANISHAEFMVDNLLLEVLLANLSVTDSLRVTEICLGIIGNLACHDNLSNMIASKNGLIETVVHQLFLDDSTCLSETFRLLTASLQGHRSISWAEALLPDQVLQRILWIIGNTLNSVLLEKSMDFLMIIVNNHEVSSVLLQPLVKLGLPNLVASLLAGELSKLGDENKLERPSILDQVLCLVEALSATDNYSQVIISNEELLPLVCSVIKLPDKIEVADSCVSAMVIIANILADGLALKLSQDFPFQQGLLDILPFVSDDSIARNAFWPLMKSILNEVQENDIGYSTLQQYASLYTDKFHIIEEDIESHKMEDSGSHAYNAIAVSVAKLACVVEKAYIPKEGDPQRDNGNDTEIPRLLNYCRKYANNNS